MHTNAITDPLPTLSYRDEDLPIFSWNTEPTCQPTYVRYLWKSSKFYHYVCFFAAREKQFFFGYRKSKLSFAVFIPITLESGKPFTVRNIAQTKPKWHHHLIYTTDNVFVDTYDLFLRRFVALGFLFADEFVSNDGYVQIFCLYTVLKKRIFKKTKLRLRSLDCTPTCYANIECFALLCLGSCSFPCLYSIS